MASSARCLGALISIGAVRPRHPERAEDRELHSGPFTAPLPSRHHSVPMLLDHMDAVVSLWKSERRARWFFGAHLQSGLGAGAGYIALLVLAYDRIGSAWGATAILLADLLPAMLLGPLLGAAIDRTSKLGAAILADVVRALAFAGLVIFDGTLVDGHPRRSWPAPGPRCSGPRRTRCCPGWSPRTACRRPTGSTAPCARPASCWARRSPPACWR